MDHLQQRFRDMRRAEKRFLDPTPLELFRPALADAVGIRWLLLLTERDSLHSSKRGSVNRSNARNSHCLESRLDSVQTGFNEFQIESFPPHALAACGDVHWGSGFIWVGKRAIRIRPDKRQSDLCCPAAGTIGESRHHHSRSFQHCEVQG